MCNIPTADAAAASCQKHSIYLSSQDQKRLSKPPRVLLGKQFFDERPLLSLADKSIRHETFVCGGYGEASHAASAFADH
jgi:hypothetical protein